MSKEYKDYHFNNFGFLQVDFTRDELSPVIDEIEKIKDQNFKNVTPSNSELVGQIEREFILDESRECINRLVSPFCIEYDRIYDYIGSLDILSKNVPLELGSVWVNFQKKHEFNPVHWHKGVYSFVIWIDIPFDADEEEQQPSSRDALINVPGQFQFLYQNILGATCTHTIRADKKCNYSMILFPAGMRHTVYPFSTSDSYRISVAGNYIFSV